MPATVCGIECDPDETNPNDPEFGAFASSGLRVRGGPGLAFEVSSVLPFGATVNVLSRQGDWAMIDATGDGGADGYVFAAYLVAS